MRHIRESLSEIMAEVDWRSRFLALEVKHASELPTRRDSSSIYDCDHEQEEIRYRLSSSGSKMYKRQCLNCGRGSQWIKRDTIPNRVNLVEFDGALEDEWARSRGRILATRNRGFDLVAERHRNERKALYHEYLSSPEWKRIRNSVVARADGQCEGCAERRADDVHHMSYDHQGAEFLFELVALCRGCHKRWHGRDNTDGRDE